MDSLASKFVVILAIVVALAPAHGFMDYRTMSYCLGGFCLLAVVVKWEEIAFCWITRPVSCANSRQKSRFDISSGELEKMKMNESLYEMHRPKAGKTNMQVLFFHGFQFGRDYKNTHILTWLSRDKSRVWPQTWLIEKFPGAHVFSVSYDARITDHDGFDFQLIGENLTTDLMDANIGQELHCPVILVGHSLGGLVIKQLCLHASTMPLKGETKCKMFLDNVNGIFYYATPHQGSPLVDKAHHFLGGPLLEYVQTLSKEAGRLNSSFNNLKAGHETWTIAGLGESVSWTWTHLVHTSILWLPYIGNYCLQCLWGGFEDIMVAPEASTRQGPSFNIVEDADHVTICQPPDQKSRIFRALEKFLTMLEEKAQKQKQAHAQEATKSQEHAIPENFQHLPHHFQMEGIEHVMKDIKHKLKTNSILGLYGMGGIGKTTLAMKTFNILAPMYEYTCFIHEVNIKCGNGSSALDKINCMKKVISENVYHLGKKIQKNIAHDNSLNFLQGKHLFVVFDDAREASDLGIVTTLKNDIKVHEDSRFIVTSRDTHLANKLNDTEIYEVPRLNDDCARQLFTSLAFSSNLKEPRVPPYLEEYVSTILGNCNGFPLALVALGQYLRKRSDTVWKQAILDFDKARDVGEFERDIWAILKSCYDGLRNPMEKEMFLDAATVFKGWSLDHAKVAWNGTMKGREVLNWQRLVDLSLAYEAKLENNNGVHMHGQFLSLGREIAKTSGTNGKCTRVWEETTPIWDPSEWNSIEDDIEELVALRANYGIPVDTAGFDDHEREYLTRWATTCIEGDKLCSLKNLLYLSLFGSVDIDKVNGQPFIDKSTLVFLEWQSTNLTELPFEPSSLKRLAILHLCYWKKLKTLPPSFDQLSSLRILEISETECLESLPVSFGQLWKLEELVLSGCRGLEALPVKFENLRKLKYLRIRDCGLRNLDDSFSKLPQLQCLNIDGCRDLKSLPVTFGELSYLEKMSLEYSGMQTFPPSFGDLPQLKHLVVRSCAHLDFPDSVSKLRLQKLTIENCPNIRVEMLPETLRNVADLEK